jgi:hypothetical protein
VRIVTPEIHDTFTGAGLLIKMPRTADRGPSSEAPMQIVTPTIPVSNAEARLESKRGQCAEFQFASDAALERALLLARDQSWIASCSVDRTKRTLRVELSAGTGALIGLPRGAAFLH